MLKPTRRTRRQGKIKLDTSDIRASVDVTVFYHILVLASIEDDPSLHDWHCVATISIYLESIHSAVGTHTCIVSRRVGEGGEKRESKETVGQSCHFESTCLPSSSLFLFYQLPRISGLLPLLPPPAQRTPLRKQTVLGLHLCGRTHDKRLRKVRRSVYISEICNNVARARWTECALYGYAARE